MRFFLAFLPILLLLALLSSIFFWPTSTPWISAAILAISIGMAIFLSFQKHWKAYQRAECTREKMIRNLVLDLLGFLLTMAAALYVGKIAGEYLGGRAGFWIGLLAGFAGGFLASLAVRSAWKRLVSIARP